MKSPDEIKKGLFVCSGFEGNCPYCPYAVNGHCDPEGMCVKQLANDADRLIRQLQHNNAQLAIDKAKLAAENAEKDVRIQQLESDKQQLEGLLTHMNQLRDAAAGRALKMEERVHQLEAERDAAVECIGKLTVILKKYPYAATNGCAYEAYMEIKKYIEAVRSVQKEDGNEKTC